MPWRGAKGLPAVPAHRCRTGPPKREAPRRCSRSAALRWLIAEYAALTVPARHARPAPTATHNGRGSSVYDAGPDPRQCDRAGHARHGALRSADPLARRPMRRPPPPRPRAARTLPKGSAVRRPRASKGSARQEPSRCRRRGGLRDPLGIGLVRPRIGHAGRKHNPRRVLDAHADGNHVLARKEAGEARGRQ
jgi:hypothetical protein